ncbi:MAG: sugar transporter permease [Chloroflexi bacterium]|nr:sugar transporter permease [Chloroflexota bacterium]
MQTKQAPVPTFTHRRSLKRALRRNITAYLFLLPFLFLMCTFILGAAVFGLALSLYHVNYGIDTPRFIGLDNFRYLWDQFQNNRDNFEFGIGLKNIVVYAFFVIIGQTVLALSYALLLNQPLKGRSLLRTAIYLPSVTSSVAISLIFVYLYNNGGAINAFLSIFHIHGPDWLNNPNTALPAIMIMNVYTTAPTFMILFLAALQGLPVSLYEAAKVDGASGFDLFRYITLPLLRPTMFLIVAVGTIGAFQTFDQIAVMTQGGPLNATVTPVYSIYDTAFKQYHYGLGASMAAVLFAIILVVTLIQRRFIDTNIQY